MDVIRFNCQRLSIEKLFFVRIEIDFLITIWIHNQISTSLNMGSPDRTLRDDNQSVYYRIVDIMFA